jgi:hypothetical protein
MTAEQDSELEAILKNIEARRGIRGLVQKVHYNQRLVGFLDILGWSQLVAQSVHSGAAMRRLASI